MKTKFTIYFFLIYIYSSYSQFKTDLSPMVNFQSSNSITLGKFGDVPVSLYTGTPNISVPIYKISERNVELDINLQYNAQGVRVEDVPGWVGQNWALNAGGVITRTVRGTAFDELNFFHGKINILANWNSDYVEWVTNGETEQFIIEPNFGVTQRGYYYHKDKLNVPNWNNNDYLYNLAHTSYFNPNIQTQIAEQNWRMDLEPDIFTFNFMGHTGHFFLGQDGQWKVSSDSNLKVVCNMGTDVSYLVPPIPFGDTFEYGATARARFPKQLNKIKLIDDKGNIYFFEEVELTFNSAFTNQPGWNSESKCISSAFYLTKVTDVYNNTLYTFEYEKGPWQGKFSMSYDHSFLHATNVEYPIVTGTAAYSFQSNHDWHDAGFQGNGQIILPSYLKKITTESGVEITFNSELVQNALKYVRGGGNPLIDDRIDMFYGARRYGVIDNYYLFKESDMITDCSPPEQPYNNSNVWERMKNKKLTSILIKDNTNNALNVNLEYFDNSNVRLFLKGLYFNWSKKYQFLYKNLNLPHFLNMSTDRLGYYNGIPFKFTPNHNDINYWTNEINQLRVTNENVLNGSLNKIIYPTGGYTEFVFEPHSYSKKLNENNQLVNENGIIGGLRIKKIINNFGNQIETRDYIYTKSISNNISSGNLLYNPIYYKESGVIDHALSDFPGRRLCNRSINSVIPMSNIMGVQLEYTDVIEKVNGLGYTHYKFSNYEEFPDLNPNVLLNTAIPFVPKTDRSYERGNLIEKFVYNENNILLQKKKMEYFSEYASLSNAVNINFSYHIGRIGGMGSSLGYTYWLLPFTAAYRLNYGDRRLIKEETFDYFNNGSMVYNLKQNYYNSDISTNSLLQNGNLFKSKEYNLSSEQNVGNLKEFQYPFDNSNSVNNLLVNKNYLSVIGEKSQKIKGDPIDPIEITELNENKILYTTVYDPIISQNIPIPSSSNSKKGNSISETNITYSKFDDKKNITEYLKNNLAPVSVIWGYNQTKPIAILENVAYQNISQTSIDNLLNLSNLDIDSGINGTTESNLRAALNLLRASFPNAMIKTYTYDSLLGITSITDSAGDVVYYEYDDLLRLERIRDNEGKILKEYKYNYKPSYNPED